LILLTGASGFVGGAISKALINRPVRLVLRNIREMKHYPDMVYKAELSPSQDWAKGLDNINVVIHCAARAHIMKEYLSDPLSEFRLVNVDGTLNLAMQAAKAGVKRFIFVSTIKVNGERTTANDPFTADQLPSPSDPYAISKYEAESGLRLIAAKTGMEVVIIRPPLIYGPGVKANFLSMMKWLHTGIPLPLGGIVGNKRSLVYIENLVDLIRVCIDHPCAKNQIFLVSDGQDLSTTVLLQKMSQAMGCNSRLVALPPSFVKLVGGWVGKKIITDRLCDSLIVDIEKTKNLLGWEPIYSVEQGLSKTAKYSFLKFQ